jgi:hypothetical protein
MRDNKIGIFFSLIECIFNGRNERINQNYAEHTRRATLAPHFAQRKMTALAEEDASSQPDSPTISWDFHRRIQVVDGLRQISSQISARQESPGRSWIPSITQVLCEAFFASCSILRSIAFDDESHLLRLENLSFSESEVRSIHIPGSVFEIGEDCFSKCKSLVAVTFGPDSQLHRIQRSTFSDSGLISIAIPPSVEAICENAFFSCVSLTSVHCPIDSRLARIAAFAFRDASSVHLEIPCGVSFLSGAAFIGLEEGSITFSSMPRNFCLDDDLLADLSGRTLVRRFRPLAEITIGSAIDAVGEGCFAGWASLAPVTFASDSKLLQLERSACGKSGLRSKENGSNLKPGKNGSNFKEVEIRQKEFEHLEPKLKRRIVASEPLKVTFDQISPKS